MAVIMREIATWADQDVISPVEKTFREQILKDLKKKPKPKYKYLVFADNIRNRDARIWCKENAPGLHYSPLPSTLISIVSFTHEAGAVAFYLYAQGLQNK